MDGNSAIQASVKETGVGFDLDVEKEMEKLESEVLDVLKREVVDKDRKEKLEERRVEHEVENAKVVDKKNDYGRLLQQQMEVQKQQVRLTRTHANNINKQQQPTHSQTRSRAAKDPAATGASG